MTQYNPGHRTGIQSLAWPWHEDPAGFPVLRRLRRWVARALTEEAEHRRLFPWLAVAFGLGIILFFAADAPSLWAPLAGAGLGAAAAIGRRAQALACGTALACAAVCAGFSAGVIRTRTVAAPVLARTIIAPAAGFLETIEKRPNGARLTLRLHSLEGLDPAELPRRIRVSSSRADQLIPGQFIAATARLLPPPEPALPGGYDFARDAYFRQIGAVGSFVGAVSVRDPPVPAPLGLRLEARIDRARNALAERIATAIGGPAGAVAAALVTGKRSFIDEDTTESLRAAGLYHIISISGLHMVLAAGLLFGTTRAVLALVPVLALTWPIKKIAALVAMAGASAYCLFSGSETATERAWIMTLVMLGAILVDRPALSMRNLAIAALIVLAREPETLLGPSFQMSFGAVAALIAFAGWFTAGSGGEPSAGPIGRALHWMLRAGLGLIGTTLVASFATAPFGAFHFHTLHPLGLIGNALALPLVSLAVMPAAGLGLLAYPLGLDGPVWQAMGAAVAQVLAVAEWVSQLSGATVRIPAFGTGALGLLVLALLLATLTGAPLRWLALGPAMAGILLAASPERFEIVVDRDGAGAAIRDGSGRLVLLGRPGSFVVEQWLRADGDGRSPDDVSLRAGVRCDRVGCVARSSSGRMVAYAGAGAALDEDCRRAAVVIARLRVFRPCASALLVDRAHLAQGGALTIRWEGERPAIRAVHHGAPARPWSRRPAPAAPIPSAAAEPAPRAGREAAEDAVSSGAPD